MANPHRGQVALTTGQGEYILAFSINATCELEDHYNLPFSQVVEKLNVPSDQIRMGDVRAFVWFALRENHPDITLEEAGTIAFDAGLPVVLGKITQCIKQAFSTSEGKKKPDPRRAAKE